jgi:hypothetical protein
LNADAEVDDPALDGYLSDGRGDGELEDEDDVRGRRDDMVVALEGRRKRDAGFDREDILATGNLENEGGRREEGSTGRS